MATKPSPLRRAVRIWRRFAIMHMQTSMTSRLEFATYIAGKLIRLGFFFVFALSLFQGKTTVLGYARGELLLFFGVMTLIDMGLQIVFRGLMAFPQTIRNGDFDAILSKPLSPLFWAALRMFDPMDLLTLPVALGFLGYAIHLLPYTPSFWRIGIAVALLFAGFLIALAMNILAAALAFWSPHIENAYWLYRDLSYVSRFPPETFPVSVRQTFIFIVPILVSVSFPAKALMGRLPVPFMLWSGMVALLWLSLASFTWRAGLKRYTSASS